MSNGKGDTYRSVNQKLWDENYERIFGKARQCQSRKSLSDANESDADRETRTRNRSIDQLLPTGET